MILNRRLNFSVFLLIILVLSSCNTATSSGDDDEPTIIIDSLNSQHNDTIVNKKIERKMADATTILQRKQVPVLCYHQIREWTASDSKSAKEYITPVATFRDQLKMLADSGYTSILPDQLYDYLVYGTELPEKPVMITFDDNDATQYYAANPIMKEFGFKGVYFIMTVTIGRSKYMNKVQLRELSDEGNSIGSHTWDHHNVRQYKDEDWITQIDKPSIVLEEITGKKIEYFAFPFGAWNKDALDQLTNRGMKASFILSTKRDPDNPIQTVRRIIGSGYWSGKALHSAMVRTFEFGK